MCLIPLPLTHLLAFYKNAEWRRLDSVVLVYFSEYKIKVEKGCSYKTSKDRIDDENDIENKSRNKYQQAQLTEYLIFFLSNFLFSAERRRKKNAKNVKYPHTLCRAYEA